MFRILSPAEIRAHEIPLLLQTWADCWELPLLPAFVRVRFSRLLHAAPSRSYPTRAVIMLNEPLLAEHPEALASVLCHEAAHVAAYLRWGHSVPSHGSGWQSLMRRADYAPEARCGVASAA